MTFHSLTLFLLATAFGADLDRLATSGICVGKPDECLAAGQEQPGPALRILFALGSSELTEQARTMLASFARTRAADGQAARGLLVEGYTDAIGRDAANLDLSTRRARTVARFLAEQGLDAQRIVAVGKGEIVEDNGIAENPLNRRVDISDMTP